MIVLSIGLLGIAGLQASGLRNNHAAYTKTQATNLAMDMAERIRANPQGQASYNGFNSNAAPDDPGCILIGCTPQEVAQHDQFEWSQPLNAPAKPILPAGRGEVNQNGGQFTVTILWREVAYDGMAPNKCDDGNFDDEADDIACFQLSFQP